MACLCHRSTSPHHPTPQHRSPSSSNSTSWPSHSTSTALLDGIIARRAARQEAYEALDEPLDAALARLDARLDPEFVAFCEAASVRGAALHVVSRGFKPIVRHYCREEGLGHVAVLANELHVGTNNRWRVSFRDGSPSGHDKARSLKAALRLLDGERRVVYVGRTACDAAPVDGGLVHHLYAPAGSALGVHCERAGHAHRAFPGWTALARELSSSTT